jgi:hypothetical protein
MLSVVLGNTFKSIPDQTVNLFQGRILFLAQTYDGLCTFGDISIRTTIWTQFWTVNEQECQQIILTI